MIMLNLTKITLTNTMMIGVIMTICSNNWISMWMGLELSLLSFMPLIQNKLSTSSESMIKYFIIQSIASTMFLFSVISMLIGVSMMNEMIMMMSMLIKIGAAPFHNWVLMIIEKMDYFSMFMLLTMLKIPPLTIMFNINSTMLTIPIIMSMLMSSISCINQSSMKKTIGYSSIFNMGLMLSSINKFNVTIMFLMLYSMTMIMLILTISLMKINWINQMIFNEFSIWMKINLWVNMLSMGGFPPMLGFIMKMLILENLIFNNQLIITVIMLMTSMLVMMFYTRLAFSCMLNSSLFKKWVTNQNKPLMFFMAMNLLMTPFSLTLMSSM
uniref:NADH-ubiquinone oxidoreductase chain 2 n=1 Tax=Alobaldia tobae TaxID=2040484 RepID=A0A343KJ57_9HEMI|nr:NADH dehydrogenase subunit 2 [Alobaldia tobae]